MLTHEEVAKMLTYDAHTGELTWLVRKSHRALAGDLAGCIERQGYCVIGIDGKLYQAHRLGWLLATGEWPKHEIDHINGNRADNRLVNLRDVPHHENMQNKRISKNPNRLRGTTQVQSGKWQASIRRKNQHVYLGLFSTTEEAHAAYMAALID